MRTPWGRVLAGAVAVLAAGTALGLVILWPGHISPAQQGQALGGTTVAATVIATRQVPCDGPVAQTCRQIDARVGEGADRGRATTITLGPSDVVANVDTGTKVRLLHVEAAPGQSKSASYELAGVDRRDVLLWLALGFVALVLLLTRWHGLLALVGFALSLLLVTRFIVPELLATTPRWRSP